MLTFNTFQNTVLAFFHTHTHTHTHTRTHTCTHTGYTGCQGTMQPSQKEKEEGKGKREKQK